MNVSDMAHQDGGKGTPTSCFGHFAHRYMGVPEPLRTASCLPSQGTVHYADLSGDSTSPSQNNQTPNRVALYHQPDVGR